MKSAMKVPINRRMNCESPVEVCRLIQAVRTYPEAVDGLREVLPTLAKRARSRSPFSQAEGSRSQLLGGGDLVRRLLVFETPDRKVSGPSWTGNPSGW